jgi:PST family polysaccharide transporter
VLQKELEFRKRFICQLVRTIAYAVTALVLAFAGAGVWSLIAGFAAGHVANGIALLVLTPYRVRWAYDRPAAREVVREGRGFVLQDGMDFAQQNADYLIIGRVLGAHQLGYYTMSFRQAELPHYAVADPVNRVTFPSFARMRERGEDVGSAYLVALGMVALAVLPLGAILSGAARPFVETFFGDKWLPMIGVLAVLGVWGAIRPLEVTVGWMLNAMGHAAAVGRVALLLFALLVPAIVLAAHQGGIEGVGWVMLGHAGVALLVLTALVHRRAGVTFARQWRVLAPLLAAAGLAWLIARSVAGALDGIAPVPALALASAGAVAGYLLAVRLLEPQLLGLALSRARRAVGRGQPGPTVPLPE